MIQRVGKVILNPQKKKVKLNRDHSWFDQHLQEKNLIGQSTLFTLSIVIFWTRMETTQ